jgi:beta-glucosidase
MNSAEAPPTRQLRAGKPRRPNLKKIKYFNSKCRKILNGKKTKTRKQTMLKFPKNFRWGAATASYQIEGAWLEGGKGLSIWDAFAHTPGKILNGDTGDVGCDHFHKYQEDVAVMAQLGLKHYRFSISWPRILPQGTGTVNRAGIAFYSDLIDSLLEHGITPWVTLYHWDLPLTLQLEHDGWLNPQIALFFQEYARICFENFGDRVKHWITLNEPWVVAMLGYGQGEFPPARISNSEPYQAGHHLLRAHAHAVNVYREQFQAQQNGVIGLTCNCDWREPLTNAANDQAAAQRALEFFLGWFADPVHLGDYPAVMKTRLGDRLPTFSANDKALLKGSSDFFGLNHYTTAYAAHAEPGAQTETSVYGNGGIAADQAVLLSWDKAWRTTAMGWSVVPWGCRKLLKWVDARYGHPEIVLTENGCAVADQVTDGQVNDQFRVNFLRDYLTECHQAIEEGVDLTGYFLWSFMDNFEWASGFSRRFGIHYVDYKTGQRIPKASAAWYGQVIRNNGF